MAAPPKKKPKKKSMPPMGGFGVKMMSAPYDPKNH